MERRVPAGACAHSRTKVSLWPKGAQPAVLLKLQALAALAALLV